MPSLWAPGRKRFNILNTLTFISLRGKSLAHILFLAPTTTLNTHFPPPWVLSSSQLQAPCCELTRSSSSAHGHLGTAKLTRGNTPQRRRHRTWGLVVESPQLHRVRGVGQQGVLDPARLVVFRQGGRTLPVWGGGTK